MDKDFSDVAGGILDLLNNAGADPSEALSVLLTCAGNLGYDIGIDGDTLEEGAASAIQSIYMQRDRIDRGASYDISRLRADMMRHSLGAAFGAQIPEALDTAMAIQDTPDENLVQMARTLGIDVSKYRISSARKSPGKHRKNKRAETHPKSPRNVYAVEPGNEWQN